MPVLSYIPFASFSSTVLSVVIFILLVSILHPTPSAYSGECKSRETKGKGCKRCKCKLDGFKLGVYKEIDPQSR